MSKIPLMTKARIASEILTEVVRKNVGIVMLIAGTFTLGYAVKNMEDAKDRERSHTNLSEVQQSMTAECNARVLQADKLASMRDQLVADQTGRLEQQNEQLRSQGLLIQLMSNRQAHAIAFSHRTMAVIEKAASEARTNAVIAAKGATAQDRQKINSAVKETK
jgi:hypothetical protein